MAERVGFEPTVESPLRRISSAVLSTTQPPLRQREPVKGLVIQRVVQQGPGPKLGRLRAPGSSEVAFLAIAEKNRKPFRFPYDIFTFVRTWAIDFLWQSLTY